VIEPAWLWPDLTMRPEREEMPGSRLPGLPLPLLWSLVMVPLCLTADAEVARLLR
jgi:hypothetical protein